MAEHDVIHLRGLEFYAYHGALSEENILGQKFIIDVDLFADLQPAGVSDLVQDTLHYGEVYEVIKACVCEQKHRLIERLAESIAQAVLARFACRSIRVEVHKPQAPVAGIFRDISVEIRREAGETG